MLEAAEVYPHNLGEGKLYGAKENDIFYLKGCCLEALGMAEKANEFFTKATHGLSEPVQAIYYNDQQPDKIFYQGLGWKKLGQLEKARKYSNGLFLSGLTTFMIKLSSITLLYRYLTYLYLIKILTRETQIIVTI